MNKDVIDFPCFIKKLVRFLKQRELYFLLLVYPALIYLCRRAELAIKPWTEQNANYYGYISFSVFLLVAIFVGFEVVIKIYSYGLQGDKLRIRSNEGLDIEDIEHGKK